MLKAIPFNGTPHSDPQGCRGVVKHIYALAATGTVTSVEARQ